MKCGTQIMPAPAPTAPPISPTAPAAPPPSLPAAKLVLPDMKEIPISGTEKNIGRDDFLKVASPDDAKFISREHLKITYENGRYYIVDERSTNGTKLNGVEIKGQGKRELNANDEIVLADTMKVRFQM
jgi:pSer/pThr/pTyr-binding forkhead associated (FHA) protein